jgi:hypothetical protein
MRSILLAHLAALASCTSPLPPAPLPLLLLRGGANPHHPVDSSAVAKVEPLVSIYGAVDAFAVLRAAEEIPALRDVVERERRVTNAKPSDAAVAAGTLGHLAKVARASSQRLVLRPEEADENVDDEEADAAAQMRIPSEGASHPHTEIVRRRVFEQLVECVECCVGDLSTADLARVVWALAVLGRTPGPLLSEAAAVVARRAAGDASSAADLADAVWAFACAHRVLNLASAAPEAAAAAAALLAAAAQPLAEAAGGLAYVHCAAAAATTTTATTATTDTTTTTPPATTATTTTTTLTLLQLLPQLLYSTN